jgi:uncharacterized protein YkwD
MIRLSSFVSLVIFLACISYATALPAGGARRITATTPRGHAARAFAVRDAADLPARSSAVTSASDIQAYLYAHNSIRSKHGARDLTWSNDLAATAQNWANGCKFQHSGGKFGGKMFCTNG